MSVFITRRIPAAGEARLREAGVEFEVGQPIDDTPVPREVLLAGVRDHDVVLSLLTERIDREVLTANPRLRGVSNMAVGLDNVDCAAAEELGIPVGNTPGVLTDATADLAWALLMAASRHVAAGHRFMLEGRFELWGPEMFCGVDVGPGVDGRRKTLGIVGYGRIGRACARRARGFDMDVVACGRSLDAPAAAREDGVHWLALPDLLERADFVSLHCPLNDATHHLLGAAEFARMKSQAVLVNTARGPVVDEAALVTALRAGEIGAAGLDVFEREPVTAPGLLELDNVVALPHIGSATRATRDRMAVMAADNAVRFLAQPRG